MKRSRSSYRTVDPGLALTELGRSVVAALGPVLAVLGLALLLSCGDDLRLALGGLIMLAASLPCLLRGER